MTRRDISSFNHAIYVTKGKFAAPLGVRCLSLAGYTVDDQIRIIKRRAESMGQRVTEFAAFMNRSRRFRRHMAADTAGKRELLEKLLHAIGVLRQARIKFGVTAFEPGKSMLTADAGETCSRPDEILGRT